mmetsp:Transcript_1688/g.6963  ORF Transcript_1688/g.6963 Transcript_1688/m.6963 type:complete len:220 (+) Transcript_1688:869-1528(+)
MSCFARAERAFSKPPELGVLFADLGGSMSTSASTPRKATGVFGAFVYVLCCVRRKVVGSLTPSALASDKHTSSYDMDLERSRLNFSSRGDDASRKDTLCASRTCAKNWSTSGNRGPGAFSDKEPPTVPTTPSSDTTRGCTQRMSPLPRDMRSWSKRTSQSAFSTISEGSNLISSKTSNGASRASRAPQSARMRASSRRTLESLRHSRWPKNSNASVVGS